jgi:hypothetical protein
MPSESFTYECFTYEDSINGIKFTMPNVGEGGLLIVGEVQVMLTPHGKIVDLATKSLEDWRTRIYYFVDDRCKDEISHFYSFNKNGHDGIAVFYEGENKVERIRYYEKDEEIWSKVEPEK